MSKIVTCCRKCRKNIRISKAYQGSKYQLCSKCLDDELDIEYNYIRPIEAKAYSG